MEILTITLSEVREPIFNRMHAVEVLMLLKSIEIQNIYIPF